MRDTKQKKIKRKPSPATKIVIDGVHYYDVGQSYSGSAFIKTTEGDFWVYPCDKWHEEN